MVTAEGFASLDLKTLRWEDMQQALSQIHRFCGAGISVLEHSLRLYRMAKASRLRDCFASSCLLHDVEEMVGMVDIPRPEKELHIWAPIVQAQREFGARIFRYYYLDVFGGSRDIEMLKEWDTWASWVEAKDLPREMEASVVRLWGDLPIIPADWAREYRSFTKTPGLTEQEFILQVSWHSLRDTNQPEEEDEE